MKRKDKKRKYSLFSPVSQDDPMRLGDTRSRVDFELRARIYLTVGNSSDVVMVQKYPRDTYMCMTLKSGG
jgi:hypothetical protein